MTTASDAWMSILERCFLNPGFLKRDQRLRCPVLNGESSDVPEDIVVDWSLRVPCVAPLNVKTTLNVKTAKCEKPNNR